MVRLLPQVHLQEFDATKYLETIFFNEKMIKNNRREPFTRVFVVEMKCNQDTNFIPCVRTSSNRTVKSIQFGLFANVSDLKPCSITEMKESYRHLVHSRRVCFSTST